MTTPPRLQKGSHIRVIAPARSCSIFSDELIKFATDRLESLGYTISFGQHVNESDMFKSSSIDSRISDLHDAFSDKSVDGILTAIGGYNSNHLLNYIDYEIIKNNPKVLCGYSDITALQNAILAKTGLVTYYGPHFSSFAEQSGFEYSQKYFDLAVTTTEPYEITPSKTWSNDSWYRDQEKRHFMDTTGWWPIQTGQASGTLVGGNLCTLNLLQGTPFMPSLKDIILFIEDDSESAIANFDRDLQSLLQIPDIKINGVLIGRFEQESEVEQEMLVAVIKSKQELKDVPVIGNMDFGHTEPRFTLPIGGQATIGVTDSECTLTITP